MEAFSRDFADIIGHPYIALIIVMALAFDFINGFHDAANSIATIVGTRVLRPIQAVIWAAFWNFAAMWFFGFHVANTVAKWVHVEYVNPDVILAALIGAIVWNLITWYYGIPSSSSHALLGGLIGSSVTFAMHFRGVLYDDKVWQTVIFIVVAPMIGLVLGLIFVVAVMWVFRKTTMMKVDRWFRVAQLGSAAAYSLGHGTNDAQKTMGVIAVLLYAGVWNKQQQAEFNAGHFPFWIALACFLTIAVGTMSGGWRIVKTMGLRITKLRPYDGACAEIAAATSLFTSSALGIPVSTTHTITGAIVGVGSVHRLSAVRWGVARQVVWAWLLTIPCSAVVAALVQWLLQTFHHH